MAGGHRVAVTGTGVVSALGDSSEELYAALCAGDSAIAPVESFTAEGLGCRSAGEVRDFDPATAMGKGKHRFLDRTARFGVAATRRALAAAGFDEAARQALTGQGGDLGLVLGTMFGSVRTIAEFDRRALTAGPLYAKPMDFANSVINAAAGQIAIWHGLTGLNATLSGGPVASASALAYATDLVRSGREPAVLAGGSDELCFESFLGFERAGLLASQNGRPPEPRPFDRRRSGFIPGEGAAILALESAAHAERRGVVPRAYLLGHGTAFDRSRGRDPEVSAAAGERAIRAALADAGVTADEVGALSAAASGSVPGDRCEARALGRVLGARAAEVPVIAVKSMLGEALGASVALQTVVLIETMRAGRVPGIRGLEQVEDELPVAAGNRETRSAEIAVGLVHAVGFDGHHATLVLSREPR